MEMNDEEIERRNGAQRALFLPSINTPNFIFVSVV
jgi:hypothetical protein